MGFFYSDEKSEMEGSWCKRKKQDSHNQEEEKVKRPQIVTQPTEPKQLLVSITKSQPDLTWFLGVTGFLPVQERNGNFRADYVKLCCGSFITLALLFYLMDSFILIADGSFDSLILLLVAFSKGAIIFITWIFLLIYVKDICAFLTALGERFTCPKITWRVINVLLALMYFGVTLVLSVCVLGENIPVSIVYCFLVHLVPATIDLCNLTILKGMAQCYAHVHALLAPFDRLHPHIQAHTLDTHEITPAVTISVTSAPSYPFPPPTATSAAGAATTMNGFAATDRSKVSICVVVVIVKSGSCRSSNSSSVSSISSGRSSDNSCFTITDSTDFCIRV